MPLHENSCEVAYAIGNRVDG